MPTEARWYIRTAFVHLAAALTLALVRAAQSAGLVPGAGAALWLPQLHLLTVGWLTQLIFGVAYWLFPTDRSAGPASTAVWMAYGALNAGLVLRVAAEPAVSTTSVRGWALLTSATLQWAASLLLVGHFWTRVRPK